MVTMIVTKVVECSRLSVRMGKKKTRMGWERKEGPPPCLCPVLAFNFLTLTCFFCLSQLIVWKRHKMLVIYIVIFKLQSATVFIR